MKFTFPMKVTLVILPPSDDQDVFHMIGPVMMIGKSGHMIGSENRDVYLVLLINYMLYLIVIKVMTLQARIKVKILISNEALCKHYLAIAQAGVGPHTRVLS